MEISKLNVSKEPLEYTIISKKQGIFTRYYMRSPFMTSDVLISKNQALELIAKHIPSIEDSYNKIVDAVEEVKSSSNSNINLDYFPDIDDIEDSSDFFTKEDLEDIGDTIIHATVSRSQLESPIGLPEESSELSIINSVESCESSQVIDISSSDTEVPSSDRSSNTIDISSANQLEQISSLEKENQFLLIQNQTLANQLDTLRSQQVKTNENLSLLDEVNSNLRSQLSTYRERLTNSSEKLNEISNALNLSMDAFKESQKHSKDLEAICIYQDEQLNKLSDMLLSRQ